MRNSKNEALRAVSIANTRCSPERLSALIAALPELRTLSISWPKSYRTSKLMQFLGNVSDNYQAVDEINVHSSAFGDVTYKNLKTATPTAWRLIESDDGHRAKLYRFKR